MSLDARTERFLSESRKIHKNFYSYDLVSYKNSTTKVDIVCPLHGVFSQLPPSHQRGVGCPKCKIETLRSCFIGNKDDWVAKATKRHDGAYDYSKVDYQGVDTPVIIGCRHHGFFEQTPYNHQIGKGCRRCANTRAANKLTYTNAEFIAAAKERHGNRYDYSDVEYSSTWLDVRIGCESHGVFTQAPNNHLQGKGCPKCSITMPRVEIEIAAFLDSLNVKYVVGDRSQIAPLELDFYLPDFDLAIEHNGLYWHSEDKVGIQYHKRKMLKARDKGIRLLQIFEDEWATKREAVKLIVMGAVGQVPKVYARKTVVEFQRPVKGETKDFVNKYHHGGYVQSNSAVVLKENNKIIFACTLRKYSGDRKNYLSGEWELARVTSSKRVSGGLSRCISHFRKNDIVNKVISFCDLRYFDGSGLEAAGFEFSHTTDPTAYYCNNRTVRLHQRNFTKAKSVKLFGDGYRTAREAVLAHGFWRVFDAGHNRYIKRF